MSITDTNVDAAETMQEQLRQTPTQHPAVARLQATLSGQTSPDQVITSYDRMHHRHNRS